MGCEELSRSRSLREARRRTGSCRQSPPRWMPRRKSPRLWRFASSRKMARFCPNRPPESRWKPGTTLDRRKIAESLRALYRLGDYADLQAAVTPVADGVRLDFVVRENLFFNEVRIEGLMAPPSDASAAAAMQLTLGQTYRRAVVDEALERLRETLRDEGLYQAEVSAETVPHAETHQWILWCT